jgi:hypothetical protein
MTAKTRTVVIVIQVLASACGKRVPGPPPTAVAGVPRVGWVIMVGDADDPNREFVCQSEPRTECVMPPSLPAEQRFTDVHFYFHPGTADTKYTGKIQIGFIGEDRSKPHEITPNITVKRNDSAANTSVVGIVPSQPGTRNMTIVMVAEADTTHQIEDRVRVQVR